MSEEVQLNSSVYRPFDFNTESGIKLFNCGSFGMVPKSVHNSRVNWLKLIESHPDVYMSDRRLELLESRVQPLAEYIGAPLKDTVFVTNTTQGVVHVLETMGLKPGDLVVYSNVTYGPIKILLDQLRKNKGIELYELDYNVEDDDTLISYYKHEFDNFKKSGKIPKLALIDSVSSNPGLILPYERLTKLIQSYGTQVFVDGAHAFGQIKVNVSAFKPDYFVTNIHKWGYCFRGTAILYISPQHQAKIQNFVTTLGYDSSSLRVKFNWFGTIDFSNWYSAADGLEYRKMVGDDLIYDYNHKLAVLGGEYVAKLLGTKVLGAPSQIGFMANVELPINEPESLELQQELEQYILKEYGVRLRLFHFKGNWYARLSAQLHLNFDDFKFAGKALKETFDNYRLKAFTKGKL